MCGIAGLIGREPGDFAARVGPALAHRGPDDTGAWQGPSMALVHRRLAILDRSPTGCQPMASTDGRWQLVFNGEIYNYIELRSRLIAVGESFRGSSDTEVLLAWIRHHGVAGLPDLRGMFAFGLVDTATGTALLATDPHGIKPLYLAQGAGGELVFSSELRALLASALIRRELDPAALGAYLASGSVPAPLTLVAGVQRLPAGHWARWQNGRLQIEAWSPLPESLAMESLQAPPADPVALTRAALEDSVAAHMVSDVPVGLFLSSGLDSGALLALAPRGLHTFTIGFDAAACAGFDESSPAARLAAQFGAQHTPISLSAEQARNWLPSFLNNLDQPSVDGFNTWCLTRLAREQGLTVALSGLGGDELFGGYPSFRAVPRLHRWRCRAGRLAPLVAAALRMGPRRSGAKLQRIAALLAAPPGLASAYSCFRGLFSPLEVVALMAAWGIELSEPLPPSQLDGEPPERLDPLGQVAWLEGRRYLRQQLLADADTMAMAHGLELRVPFVDAVLQRRLAAIPGPVRFAPGKSLLRQAVPELPAWFTDRPKQGFRFPFQIWLDDPVDQLTLQLPSVPPQLDLQPWYRRWSLMVLQHWLRRHLDLDLESVTCARTARAP